jgi:hypothetical protein
MGKGSAPSAPDPYASANAQYTYGTKAAEYNKALNSTNTVGPTGSTTYSVSGRNPVTGAPVYTQTNTLSAPEQALLSGQEQQGLGQQAAARTALGNVEQGWSANPLPSEGDLQHFGQQAQQAAYKTATASMDPHWDQQQAQLDSSLRNSGAHPGDPAYDNAMKAFEADRSSAYGQAENQAFGQGLSSQGQMLQQIAQERGIPLSEYQALTGGGPLGGVGGGGGGASSPGAGNVNTPDIMSAFNNQYQGQLAQYNAGVASSNADVGALGTLAAAFLLA